MGWLSSHEVGKVVAVVAGRSVDFGLVGDESENLEFSGERFGGDLFIREYFSKRLCTIKLSSLLSLLRGSVSMENLMYPRVRQDNLEKETLPYLRVTFV